MDAHTSGFSNDLWQEADKGDHGHCTGEGHHYLRRSSIFLGPLTPRMFVNACRLMVDAGGTFRPPCSTLASPALCL